MVHNQIKNNLDISLVTIIKKSLKVIKSAEILVYIFIVHNIILMVGKGRRNRGEPDFICKEGITFISLSVVDVVELFPNAL